MCLSCGSLFEGASEAAEEILEKAYRVPVEKALNPLDPRQFVTIIRRVARKLRRNAEPIESAAAIEAARMLDADWPNLTGAAREAKYAELLALVERTGAQVLPGVTATLETSANVIIPSTRRFLVAAHDFAISAATNARDDKTANNLVSTTGLFVRDQYGRVAESLSQKARDIVATGLEQGLGRDDISSDLAAACVSAARPDSYWNMTATVFSNRARNFTQVHVMEEAAIERYRWSSVLDESTSLACRFMNGRIFSVPKAAKRIEKVQEQENPEDIVNTMPFIQQGKTEDGNEFLFYEKAGRKRKIADVETSAVGEKDKTGTFSSEMSTEALERAGISAPPGHYACRSTIVPEF